LNTAAATVANKIADAMQGKTAITAEVVPLARTQ
jgi:hypothetical protein